VDFADRHEREPDAEVLRERFRVGDEPGDENGPGMPTPNTDCGPSAFAAIAATTAESMPPLSPTTAVRNPQRAA
jgi:hypothetical protein